MGIVGDILQYAIVAIAVCFYLAPLLLSGRVRATEGESLSAGNDDTPMPMLPDQLGCLNDAPLPSQIVHLADFRMRSDDASAPHRIINGA